MRKRPDKVTNIYDTQTFLETTPCKECGSFKRYTAGGECYVCKKGSTKQKEYLRKTDIRRKTEDLLEQRKLDDMFL